MNRFYKEMKNYLEENGYFEKNISDSDLTIENLDSLKRESYENLEKEIQKELPLVKVGIVNAAESGQAYFKKTYGSWDKPINNYEKCNVIQNIYIKNFPDLLIDKHSYGKFCDITVRWPEHKVKK